MSRITNLLAVSLLAVAAAALGCSMRRSAGGLNHCAVPSPGAASSWERVVSLELGAEVTVILHDGRRVCGQLTSVDSEGIALENGDSRIRQVARSDIETVHMRISRRGSAAKGVLIGAAVGAGGGAALGAAVSERIDVATSLTVPVLGAIGAATGAVVGYVVDGTKRHEVLVYRSPPAQPRRSR